MLLEHQDGKPWDVGLAGVAGGFFAGLSGKTSSSPKANMAGWKIHHE